MTTADAPVASRSPDTVPLPATVRPAGSAAAALRHIAWRGAFALTGGLHTTGRLPRGGCVVVANHSSHADTPAVLAALDAAHTPRVAAAADYWFTSGLRGRICRGLVAGFPVHRGGGGFADLLAAGAVLAAGGTVVVFPAGSRAAQQGTCHAGAFRLAARHGVPVVPVTVTGTATLLPRHGRLHRSPVTVTIGWPVPVTDIDFARDVVTARLAG